MINACLCCNWRGEMPPLIHTFEMLGNKYVFDANTNAILPLDKQQWLLMRQVEDNCMSDEAKELLERFQKQNYLIPPDIQEIRHPDSGNLQYHLTRKLEKLTLQVTQNCNLRCSYCAYSDMYFNRTHAPLNMKFETAAKAIDYVMCNSIDTTKLDIGFYGGEPLLEMELIEKCIKYASEKCKGKELSFTITTNGTLLTPEIYEYLIDNEVSIMVSLDGPKSNHDASRVFPDGEGSFDIIICNLQAIQNKYPDSGTKISLLAVASTEMVDSCVPKFFSMDEVFSDFSVNLSFLSDTYIDHEIIYGDEFNNHYTRERTKILLYMLGKIDEEQVSRLLRVTAHREREDYEKFRKIPKLPSVCHPGGPCLAGAQRLFVDVNGVFYPCERVSEKSDMMRIGDVFNGIDIEKANAIINIGTTTGDECKQCWAILNCLMCAAFSDDLTSFSSIKRLSKCASSKQRATEKFKDICFLKENGYNFETVH
jgi:uncharacterized protein